MADYDLTYYYYFGDRFFGGNKFLGASSHSRVIESENEINVRSDALMNDIEMTIDFNNANTAFDVILRKNRADTLSKVEWTPNETGTKIFSLQNVSFLQDDVFAFRVTGPSLFGGGTHFIGRVKSKLQMLPRI